MKTAFVALYWPRRGNKFYNHMFTLPYRIKIAQVFDDHIWIPKQNANKQILISYSGGKRVGYLKFKVPPKYQQIQVANLAKVPNKHVAFASVNVMFRNRKRNILSAYDVVLRQRSNDRQTYILSHRRDIMKRKFLNPFLDWELRLTTITIANDGDIIVTKYDKCGIVLYTGDSGYRHKIPICRPSREKGAGVYPFGATLPWDATNRRLILELPRIQNHHNRFVHIFINKEKMTGFVDVQMSDSGTFRTDGIVERISPIGLGGKFFCSYHKRDHLNSRLQNIKFILRRPAD